MAFTVCPELDSTQSTLSVPMTEPYIMEILQLVCYNASMCDFLVCVNYLTLNSDLRTWYTCG
jgi:hypothetical protein